MRRRKRRREIKGLKRWWRERVRESNPRKRKRKCACEGEHARAHTLKGITHKLLLPAIHTSECWKCVLPRASCPGRNNRAPVMFVFVVFAPRTSTMSTRRTATGHQTHGEIDTDTDRDIRTGNGCLSVRSPFTQTDDYFPRFPHDIQNRFRRRIGPN